MKLFLLLALLLSGILFRAKSVQAQSLADDSVQISRPLGPILLANSNLIDVETDRGRKAISLLIEDGIIRKIGKNLSAPAGATVIDARGKRLMPGLIDSDTPTDLAQRQLNAYNAHDIDAFLEPYADDVELYDLPDKLLSKGKEAMRKQYATMFERTTNLHCELVNRIVVNNTVIDHERVTFGPGREPVQAVAIYKIENGKIKKVYFTR